MQHFAQGHQVGMCIISTRSVAIRVTAQVLNQTTEATVAKTFSPVFVGYWNAVFKPRNGKTSWTLHTPLIILWCTCVLRKAYETAVFFDLLRQCTQTRIFQNLLIRNWWNLAEFLFSTRFNENSKTEVEQTNSVKQSIFTEQLNS